MIAPKGNEKTIKTLEKIANSKKIPHSYIFTGIEGIGKKLTSLYFAKILNCESEKNIPCNQCSNCKKIDKNIHPDILILSTEKKQITLEMVREIISFSSSNPFEGKYKIAIIDDAHKLNQFASNALLKTIEEPTTRTIFILITDSINKLLPTILSRCIKISFTPIDNDTLSSILIDKGYDREKIQEILPLSFGSVKQAISLLDETIFNAISKINEFIEHLDTKNFFELSKFSEEINKNGYEELLFSILMKKYFSEIANFETDNPFTYLNKYQKVINFYKNLRYNINKAFLIETMLLSLQKL